MDISLCFQMLVKGLWGPDDYLIERPVDKEPAPELSSVKSTVKEDDQGDKVSHPTCTREALKPVWIFSFNHRVPIINLSNGAYCRFFFVSGHLAIIYDVKKNEQYILRGHVCPIYCFCFLLLRALKYNRFHKQRRRCLIFRFNVLVDAIS